MRALIFAAGLGERLRPHSEVLAKPAIPFLNIPLSGFGLHLLERAGLSELVVNTHHRPDTVREALTTLVGGRYALHFSHEAPRILGSGGGLGQAKRYFKEGGDVFIVNGDTLVMSGRANPLRDVLNDHQQSRALATLWLTRFPSRGGPFGGAYVNAQGEVRRFAKQAPEDESLTGYHFTGVMVAHERLLPRLSAEPSNLLYDVLQSAIAAGELVHGFVDEDLHWLETGSESEFLAATSVCLQELAGDSVFGEQLRATLNRFTPNWRLHEVGSGVVLSSGDWVAPEGLQVEDFAVLGLGAVVGPGVRLARAVILPGVVLPAAAQIEDRLVSRSQLP